MCVTETSVLMKLTEINECLLIDQTCHLYNVCLKTQFAKKKSETLSGQSDIVRSVLW